MNTYTKLKELQKHINDSLEELYMDKIKDRLLPTDKGDWAIGYIVALEDFDIITPDECVELIDWVIHHRRGNHEHAKHE